jgi:hypothetical protein
MSSPPGCRALVLRLGAALLLAGVAPRADAGGISGLVRYAGAAAALPPVPATKDRAVCGDEVADESLLVSSGRLANVVVVVKGAPPRAPARITLDQQRCRYRPRVLVAPVGSVMEVTSGDDILHSVHGWAGQVTRFEVVTPSRGVRIPTKLDRPGLIQIRCDVHSWMLAWVLVTDSPAAVSGADGEFSIGDLPPGTYQITAWHERLGEKATRVVVPAEGTARLELTFGG